MAFEDDSNLDQPADEDGVAPVESRDDSDRYPSFSAGGPDEFSIDDLEAAYLKALESSEGAEWDLAEDPDDAELESTALEGDIAEGRHENDVEGGAADVAFASEEFVGPGPNLAISEQADFADADPAATPDRANSDQKEIAARPASSASIRPAKIIEACLFVGGHPLSARKLASLLDGNNDVAVIESLIDELNHEYVAQARPYEIRLGDGGYRLSLRAEFEGVRSRVYGAGPRDVKLSQDVLEVLALVAYQQPIAHTAVEACKPNSANLLRQLLRRELISLTRIDQSRNGVEYHTTPRFLQLFGLGQLSELPRPEDLSIR